MNKYEIDIRWSDVDGAYIAEAPELPGCMADGITYEEALNNIEIVIGEWIETAQSLGRSIPKPKAFTRKRDTVSIQRHREMAYA
ncbi:MAG: type II toxin-antitoxin system HicB family antitoxin [Spirochaetaceae bacterium]|jgi:predicted RNase H-like HicB family nuclease|nr:type II toxin-antitoxin system HicB family antitoxin [Spirochaetaceae bacterium]